MEAGKLLFLLRKQCELPEGEGKRSMPVNRQAVELQVVAYPNPVNASLHIDFNMQVDARGEMINYLGKAVHAFNTSDQFNVFDLKDIAAGIYLIRITTNIGDLKTIRIIKK